MTKSAAIYCRISNDIEGAGLGVDRQERECRALCESHGLDVVATFTDNDISAYKGKHRPGFAAVQDAMKAGAVDVLVAWHPDRITRQTRELEDLIDLLDATGVDVLTVSAGHYDLRTPSGRMAARILGAVSRHESEHKGERQRSKADELARRGLPAGGRAPYGYRYEHPERESGKGGLVIHAEEAKTLRWMAEQVLAGRSTVAIQRDLDAKGTPTKQGGPWHHATVRAVLINPAVAGLRVHRREIAGPAAWAPIFDRAEWEQIRATVADPARKRSRPARKFMLTGLVRSAAGDVMNGSRDLADNRIYTTRAGAKVSTSVKADPLEEHVAAKVLIALRDWEPEPVAVDTGAGADVARIEGELQELADLRGRQVISMAEWLAAREPLTAALAEAKASAGRPRPLPAMLTKGNIAGAWEDATVEDKRQTVAAVVEYVTVNPATRGRWTTMDERVKIKWKA